MAGKQTGQSKILYNRDDILSGMVEPHDHFEVVVIGGGASGLGAALESATRGYRTLLLEQEDFSKATSSRSTNLVHGGVRYLAQGRISLVFEALRERGRLKRNAPHLVRDQIFLIPCYSWWRLPFYTIGLMLYDLLAGKMGIGRSIPLSRKSTLASLPTIKEERLKGAVRYFDCQFDDARLAVNLCQTLFEQDAIALNYMQVTGLVKKDGRVKGVIARDRESGRDWTIRAGVVINATGVFVSDIIRLDEPEAKDVVKPSQGVHLVMDKSLVGSANALMIPKTSDGRVLFAVPWHNRVVVGTTDVEKEVAEIEPKATEEEIDYLLDTAGRFFKTPPLRRDVLSIFAGLRPLAVSSHESKKTKEISRGHRILVSASGLITLTGGKWTTYRKMGEDVIDVASRNSGLPRRLSVTHILKIHGHRDHPDYSDPYYWYGSDMDQIRTIIEEDPENGKFISKKLHIIQAQVLWAVRGEMARSIEDFLARRSRALQLDAREAIRMAPKVARIMSAELDRDKQWESAQVEAFTTLATGYIIN